MKTAQLSLSALLALTLSLTGCSNDENLPGGENDGRVAIRVSSNIDVTDGASKPGTRAANDAWEANDAIGIFMLNGTTADTYSNIAYTTEDGNGTFAPEGTTIYLPVDGTSRNFVAYYPYQSLMSGSSYSIDLSNQTDQSAIDLMSSEKENGTNSTVKGITKNAPAVKFRFHHRLCKLSLSIKAGTGLAAADLNGLTITLGGQKTTGTFDVLTSDAVTATAEGNQTVTLKTAADGQTSEAIVMPSDGFSGMALTFATTNSGTYKWNVSSTSVTKFEAGKVYKFNITINKTGINVTATIEDWGAGNDESGENGSAE